MEINVEDVLFWMDAIRNSHDRYRTLESFWKGQIRSKVWLIGHLERLIDSSPKKISIHAGWNGVLASLLFNSRINVNRIQSIDIDPDCELTANTICKRQQIEGRFTAKTADITKYSTSEKFDIIINTSGEHLNDNQLLKWYKSLPSKCLIVCQSNNFIDLDEHINCVRSCNDLASKFPNFNTLISDSLETDLYTRFMIIGNKIAN